MSVIDDVVTLVNSGWRIFQGEIDRKVYEERSCPSLRNRRLTPRWFFYGDKYICIGCSKRCSLVRPEGFQARLELLYPEKPKSPFLLTPDEMLSRLRFLTVAQAAYCLNVSKSQIYKMIRNAVLLSTDSPLRIPVDEIKNYINKIY